MKKLLLLALAAALMLCIFSGCGKEQPKVSFDPAEAAQALLDSKAFSDILSPVDEKVAANLYSADPGKITACAVYCSTGATAEEVAIFQCSDEAAASELEESARARLESQAAAYAGYGPQEVPKLENADVRVAGVYMACVVSADADAAAGVLDKYMPK